MIQLYRRAKRRIGIIWRWLPIIWNDYDFDYSYILQAMKHKIERTRIDVQKCERHIDWEKDVKNMHIAEILIDRILEDEYSQCHKSEFCTCKDPLPDLYKEVPGRDDIVEWVNPFCEWCQLKSTFKTKHNREIYDWDYLFEHLRKHMQRWWD